MGAVLEFHTACHPFDRLLIEFAGLQKPNEWRCEHLNRVFWDEGLQTLDPVPRIIATNRKGDLCVVHLLAGPTPPHLSREWTFHAILDAEVVRRELSGEGRAFGEVSTRLRYGDGGFLDVCSTDEARARITSQAHELMRVNRMRVLRTSDLAVLLCVYSPDARSTSPRRSRERMLDGTESVSPSARGLRRRRRQRS